jgi:hypothetical protein
LAITPKEEKLYRKWGGKRVNTLPLRGLPLCLRPAREAREKEKINIFFMGSTYNVPHNRGALKFIIKDIAPIVERLRPGRFVFNILGNRVPEDCNKYFNNYIIYQGARYKEDLENFLVNMDIALIPSLFGAGMQQKIFEPLSRSFPTITSERGIADYPFEDRKHVLFAKTLDEYVSTILELEDTGKRASIGKEAGILASQIFSQEKIDSIILLAID